jgi:peptidyl-tRNA hydrolase, PTH1 family
MKLIIGLGNPGGEYESTRHNIGFMVIDKLAKEITTPAATWEKDNKHNALVARASDLMLVKPQLYMNRSGETVKSLADYFKITISDLWVIHDDIDLPLGKIKIRERGSSGGHNGVDSIIKAFNSDSFVRFRLGIGRGKEGSAGNTEKNFRHRTVISFVLSRFHQSEAGTMKHLVKNGEAAVRMALEDGIDKAMNRFN